MGWQRIIFICVRSLPSGGVEVGHAFNPTTLEAAADGSLNSRPAWPIRVCLLWKCRPWQGGTRRFGIACISEGALRQRQPGICWVTLSALSSLGCCHSEGTWVGTQAHHSNLHTRTQASFSPRLCRFIHPNGRPKVSCKENIFGVQISRACDFTTLSFNVPPVKDHNCPCRV